MNPRAYGRSDQSLKLFKNDDCLVEDQNFKLGKLVSNVSQKRRLFVTLNNSIVNQFQ